MKWWQWIVAGLLTIGFLYGIVRIWSGPVTYWPMMN